jgi:protein-L-isoaspartate(D-aspartate) O-methyltransferase
MQLPPSFIDNYRHKGLRKKLVEIVKMNGIENPKVLEAIGKLPRHLFLESAFEELAYEDKALPIGDGQTISQPFTVAYQTELLKLQPGMKVLEIGTGSGYQACILYLMDVEVHTIERQENLYHKTKNLLSKLGLSSIKTYFRDGFLGIPEEMPFDAILVTAGAREIPQALLNQLKIGGRIVIPVGEMATQKMLRLTRTSSNSFDKETLEDFKFVPLLKGVVKK